MRCVSILESVRNFVFAKQSSVRIMCNRFCKNAFVFTREDDGNNFERMLMVSNGDEGGIFCRFLPCSSAFKAGLLCKVEYGFNEEIKM